MCWSQMCFEQRCQPISEIGDPACPVGSNGQQCSGNGVCCLSIYFTSMVNYSVISCVLTIKYSNAATQACVHATLDSLELTVEQGGTRVSHSTSMVTHCLARTDWLLTCHAVGVNNCAFNNGGCDHICSNSTGSLQCSCRSGYQLASNGRSCSGMQISQAYMISIFAIYLHWALPLYRHQWV